LNKKELAEALYWTINEHYRKDDGTADNKLTKALSQDIISALFHEDGIIAEFLFKKPAPKTKNAKHSGNKVTIPGFGTFVTRYRKEREGNHPDAKNHPNKKIKIPATYVVSFRAGKGLKERAAKKAKKK
jgi:nucleoid DNA-binding protein